MGCSGYLSSFLILIIPGHLFLRCSVEELCEPICPKKSRGKDPLFTRLKPIDDNQTAMKETKRRFYFV